MPTRYNAVIVKYHHITKEMHSSP